MKGNSTAAISTVSTPQMGLARRGAGSRVEFYFEYEDTSQSPEVVWNGITTVGEGSN